MNSSQIAAAPSPHSPLYRASGLRTLEAKAADQPLMQRAGQAAAELAARLCRDNGAAILILAGPGNNGGDALEAGHHLLGCFFKVHLVFTGQAEKLPPDAQAALERFVHAGGKLLDAIPDSPPWGLIIDGLFGIGLQRNIEGAYANLIHDVNRLSLRNGCPLLALDCPSGLDADTGVVRGCAIRASHTLTFIALKPGLLTLDGPDYCGHTTVASLDLNPPLLAAPEGNTIAPTLFASHLAPRRRNSHKGSYGSAGILGGAPSMTGAALLTGRAALTLGCGRVYAGLLDSERPSVDLLQPELMLRTPEALFHAPLTALACGPGLSTAREALPLLEQALATEFPLVLDADALNLLAAEEPLAVAAASRQAPLLITPHPAEAARLLGVSVAEVQADRIASAQALARQFNAWTALKGCGTIVAAPGGAWWINSSGNPGLAAAGQGDVLTGLAVALLAQGWPPLKALLGAVHLHGAAADHLVNTGTGPVGLTASETALAARKVFNDWCRQN
ncbi:MAG: NAD(P)H-hydrate dehydratase [Betaproteobacteria bacterium]|nr:NAD(P)H-hydrate dehydratase [Betaproteobacteria bacterium]